MRLAPAKAAPLGAVVRVRNGGAFYRCTVTAVHEPGDLERPAALGPIFEVTREGHAKPFGTRTIAGLFVECWAGGQRVTR